MGKVTTTVLLDENLKAMAKARRISISRVCNDSLAAIVALPNTEEELIIQEHKLKQELAAVQSKKANLKEAEQISTKREVVDEMRKDVSELRIAWSDNIKGDLKNLDWGEIVTSFCKKWKVDRGMAIDFANGKKEVI